MFQMFEGFESCRECREWKEHFYWNHLDKQRTRFYTRMVGDFTQRMTIPKNFANRFSGKISEIVDLKTQSGNIWQVGVTKSPDGIILVSGWKEFVEAHRVEESDLLLFKLVGTSSFEIVIFDASGHEKASSLFVTKKDPQLGESNAVSVEIVSVENIHEVIAISSSTNSSEVHAKPANCGVRRTGLDCGGRPRKDVGPSKGAEHDQKSEFSASDERELELHLELPYRSPPLPDWQEKKLSALALAARPNPTFVAIMHWSNITAKSNFVNIPKKFADAHLQPRSHEIVLKIPNGTNKWFVSYILGSDRRGICGGWKGFATDNNLRKGDICLFELMKNSSVPTMTVHII
uniref:TF-B3 domain-containing protein n=1 Tax=Ananas comosus var. bracteatus TaxID=296719 RepID=A0A6V7QE89_ANACO|nr:unnamed protein product [Ananas comosus var. bracteatus]